MKVEVKICGLTNAGDAEYALGAGADYLGFVLYDKSPRGITSGKLREIMDDLRSTVRAIGVFVNASREFVERVTQECELYAVQIHGDEDPTQFESMSCQVWRATSFQDGIFKPVPEAWPAERYVVDAVAPSAYGGTGTLADWQAAADLAGRRPVMLAGGLTVDNVREAISRVCPLGVDVSSGVECEPGRKDRAKVKNFIRAVRKIETQRHGGNVLTEAQCLRGSVFSGR